MRASSHPDVIILDPNHIKRNNLAEDEVEILCHRYKNEVSIRLNFPQPVSDNSEDMQHEVGQPAASRKSEMPLSMTLYRTKTIPKYTAKYDQSFQKKSASLQKYSASLQMRKFQEKCARSSSRRRKKKLKSPAKIQRDRNRFHRFQRSKRQSTEELDVPSSQLITHEHDIISQLVIEPIQHIIFVMIYVICFILLLYDS